jgi:MarR family transcriptional regulator, organic hydroperoxide resistance regulator
VFRDTVGMRLRGAYLTFHRMANAHFELFGATADQFVVLTLLAEADGVTQREVVEQAFSDPNTIGEMLTRLEKKKLIEREQHPHDGRARCVYLTAKGRKVQRQLWDSWEERLQEVNGAFRPEELKVLKGLLARIPDAVAVPRDAKS